MGAANHKSNDYHCNFLYKAENARSSFGFLLDTSTQVVENKVEPSFLDIFENIHPK